MGNLSSRELKNLLNQDREDFIMPDSPRRNKRQRPPKHMRSSSDIQDTESRQPEPVSEKTAPAPQAPAPSATPAPATIKPAAAKKVHVAKAPVAESKKMTTTASTPAVDTKAAKPEVDVKEKTIIPESNDTQEQVEIPNQSIRHEDGPVAKLVKAIKITNDGDPDAELGENAQNVIKKLTDAAESPSVFNKMSKDVDGITVGVMSHVMLEAVGHGGKKIVEDKFRSEQALFEYLQPKTWKQIGKDFVQLLFGVEAAYRGGNHFDTIPHLMDKDRGASFRGHTLTLLMEFLADKVAGVTYSDESRQMIATFANGSNVCFTVLDDGKVVTDWSGDYGAHSVFEKNALINGVSVDIDKALPAIDFVIRDRVVENFTIGVGEAILAELASKLTGDEAKASSK